METKFTPGPWRIRKTSVYDAVYTDDDILIAFVGIRENEEAQANNALIAAAPELYEALQLLINALHKHTPDMSQSALADICPACDVAAVALTKAQGGAK